MVLCTTKQLSRKRFSLLCLFLDSVAPNSMFKLNVTTVYFDNGIKFIFRTNKNHNSESHKIVPRRISTSHSILIASKCGNRKSSILFKYIFCLVSYSVLIMYLIDAIAICSPFADRLSACNCRRRCRMQVVPTVHWTDGQDLLYLSANAKIQRRFSWCARRFFHHNTNAPY